MFQDYINDLIRKGSNCVIIFTDDPDYVRPQFVELFGPKLFEDCKQDDMWGWPRLMFHGDQNWVEYYRTNIPTDRPACQQVGLRTQKLEAFQLDLLCMAYCNKFVGTSSSTVTYLVRWVRHSVLKITEIPQEVINFGPPGEFAAFTKADPNEKAREEINKLFWNSCDNVVNMLHWKMNHAQLKLLRTLPDEMINFVARELDEKLIANGGLPIRATQAVEDILKKNREYQELYSRCSAGYNQMRGDGPSCMGWFKALVMFRINPFRASTRPHAALFELINNGANLQWKMNNVHNVLPGRKAGTGGPHQESVQAMESASAGASSSSNKRPAPVMMTSSKSRPPTKKPRN